MVIHFLIISRQEWIGWSNVVLVIIWVMRVRGDNVYLVLNEIYNSSSSKVHNYNQVAHRHVQK